MRPGRHGIRRLAAAGLGAGLLLGAGPAAGIAHGATSGGVTIDCAGDGVAGVIAVPTATGRATVQLIGRDDGTSTEIARTSVRLDGSALAKDFSFRLTRHVDSYQARVTVGNKRFDSPPVRDGTCQPPAQVAETSVALLAPAVMAASAGLSWVVATRRRRRVAV